MTEDLMGYAGASLVLLTFCMTSMKWLRIVGLFSNMTFIGYALLAGLMPIMALHSALLVINLGHLIRLTRRPAGPVPEPDLGACR